MENQTLNRLFMIEAAIIFLLVIAAVFVRIGIVNAQNEPVPPETEQTEAPDVPVISPTEDSSTEAPPTQTESTEPEEPAPTPIMENMELSARNAFAYNLESGTLYYLQGDWTERVYPASVTKLFSAYVALQYLDPETVITAGDELDLMAEDSSIAFIHAGNQLTVSMLIEGMLLPSGNDAAYMLAAAAAKAERNNPYLSAEAAIARFVELMNETAKSLDMRHSHFVNPDGYHADDHYTSSKDLLTIARLALENPVISQYASLHEDDVVYASGHTNSWTNTNALLNPWSSYYCPEAVGLKTGHTDEAGYCLLSAFRHDGELVVVGMFGCEERGQRFSQTIRLYQALPIHAE